MPKGWCLLPKLKQEYKVKSKKAKGKNEESLS
jgi:hypothetical protein